MKKTEGDFEQEVKDLIEKYPNVSGSAKGGIFFHEAAVLAIKDEIEEKDFLELAKMAYQLTNFSGEIEKIIGK